MNKQQLIEDLKNAGIQKGMVLFVHSSFKSLGFEGKPIEVIESLMEILTEEGTLLFPTLTYATVNQSNPYFSYHDTPSCVGILSETFRKIVGVNRSFDPIHSVCAWGKYAKKLTSSHHLDYSTLGTNSPFYLMLEYSPKILMLGCGLKPNTFMHLVENLFQAPYRITKYQVDFIMINEHYALIKKSMELPDMKNYVQRYDRIIDVLDASECKEVMILNAKSYIIDAHSLLNKAGNAIQNNPFYFVDLKE
jgi:aminoglycoside 3-N-acetyltransferase